MSSSLEHTSKVQKEAALKNIKAKHRIIQKWLTRSIPWKKTDDGNFVRDESGERELDWLPNSLRQFNKWNGSQNCLKTQKSMPIIKGNSTKTLDQHLELKQQIDADIKALKQKALVQSQNSNKTALVEQKSEELELVILQKASIEINYQQSREKLIESQESLDFECRRHQQTIKLLESQREKTADVEAQLAEAISTINKVKGIRSVE